MEPGTIFVLTIQLIALFSIAGALLLYLLCKVRGARQMPIGPQGGSILITSADTALGLQLCTHLANRGCRVFAGMKDPVDSLPAKLLRGWMKMRENSTVRVYGSIVPLRLDVTREDILREATEAMGAHLNASERGNSVTNFVPRENRCTRTQLFQLLFRRHFGCHKYGRFGGTRSHWKSRFHALGNDVQDKCVGLAAYG